MIITSMTNDINALLLVRLPQSNNKRQNAGTIIMIQIIISLICLKPLLLLSDHPAQFGICPVSVMTGIIIEAFAEPCGECRRLSLHIKVCGLAICEHPQKRDPLSSLFCHQGGH